MRTLVAGLGAVALTAASLLTATGPAHAETPTATCADPRQPIVESLTFDSHVSVGTKKTKRLRLDVYTHAGCDVSGAKATVQGPRSTRTVALQPVESDGEYVRWQGTLAISPRSLRNSDAGAWQTTYRVRGEHADSQTVASHVRRATRVSFNAGPEPVRNNRLTYSGHVERASWNTKRYHDSAGRLVTVTRIFLDEEDREGLAEPVTRSDGTFRVTRPYAGPGFYLAIVDGTRITAGAESRRDRVDTPQ